MERKDWFPSIQDEGLNAELNSVLRYSKWLILQLEEAKEIEELLLLVKKDIIIHLGAIIEGILFYIAQEYMRNNKLTLEKSQNQEKQIHTISESEYIAFVQKKMKNIKLKDADFNTLICAFNDQWIIQDSLCDDLHAIRNFKNGIHLSKKILQDELFRSIDIHKEYMPLFNSILGGLKKLMQNG